MPHPLHSIQSNILSACGATSSFDGIITLFVDWLSGLSCKSKTKLSVFYYYCCCSVAAFTLQQQFYNTRHLVISTLHTLQRWVGLLKPPTVQMGATGEGSLRYHCNVFTQTIFIIIIIFIIIGIVSIIISTLMCNMSLLSW